MKMSENVLLIAPNKLKGSIAVSDHQESMIKFIFIEYGIFGEGSQICHYCLRRKGHKSQLLAGEGSQISLF